MSVVHATVYLIHQVVATAMTGNKSDAEGRKGLNSSHQENIMQIKRFLFVYFHRVEPKMIADKVAVPSVVSQQP